MALEPLYIRNGAGRITQTHLTEKSMNRKEQQIATFAQAYGTAEEIKELDFAEAEAIVAAMTAKESANLEDYLNEGMVDDCSESTSGTQQAD